MKNQKETVEPSGVDNRQERFEIAKGCMYGMCSNAGFVGIDMSSMAGVAFRIADAMLAEHAKTA